MHSDLSSFSATAGLQELRNGSFTPSEWLESFVARIEACGELNLYISDTTETARESATQALSRYQDKTARPLEGLPIAIKDIFCTKAIRTTAGSKFLSNFVPPYESTVTARLQEAGAIVLGKTNLDEFAMGSSTEHSAFGATHNPWSHPDKPLVPGGSSGGSAAAVAARAAPVALGTDTGGSVRQPASFCGVMGFKPTYGRLSRHGVIAYASSLDQPGIFARSLADVELLYRTAAGHDPLDSTSAVCSVDAASSPLPNLSGVKIGVPREYHTKDLDGEIESVWQQGAETLRQLGAEVEEISLPHTEAALAAYYVIAPAEASSNLARYDGVRYGLRAEGDHKSLDAMYEASRSLGFGKEVQRRILIGTYVLSAGYYDAYYNRARRVRALVAQDFAKAFERVDYVLAPATPSAAFPLGAEATADPTWMYQQDIFTVPVSLAGLPALSLPAQLNKAGLPLGLQLIAPAFGERELFAAAALFNEALDFKAVPPGLVASGANR